MCPALSPTLVNPALSAEARETESLSKRVSGAVRDQLWVMALTRLVWKLDSKLADFLNSFYKGVTSGTAPAAPPTEGQIREAIRILRSIWTANDEMYRKARTSGLTNRRFIGTALNSIRMRSEEILDIVETIETALDDRTVDGIFEKARAEFERGETIDISAL